MGLACGIVGLPNVGKTTIFGAITGLDVERSDYMFSTTGPVQGTVDVPDERLARIAELIPTRRIVPAQMTLVDIPGLVSGSSRGEGMGIGFLGSIKDSDVLLHVVRCFDKPGVQHVSGALDPATDAEVVDLELGQADLATLERNIERVAKKARAGDKAAQQQQAVFERAREVLAGGRPLRAAPWSAPELQALKPLFLMTLKQMLFVANVGDDDLEGNSEHVQALRAYAAGTGCEVLPLCGDLEAELVRMEPSERAPLMAELGLRESGLHKLIHKGFDLLGLQTFFTAGEIEVRAWVIHKGDTGPVGAGVIHTDFAKKYIRAEVYSFDDLMEHKSEAAIRAAGKLRIEGKDYVLRDGDICHFLIG
jgi:GTP-binding protein YchF